MGLFHELVTAHKGEASHLILKTYQECRAEAQKGDNGQYSALSHKNNNH